MPATDAATFRRRSTKRISQESFNEKDENEKVRLPQLPIPDLQETLQQYLHCVKPLVNETQFSITKSIVDSFGRSDGLGPKVQEKLLEFAQTKENWASEWWLKDMYLDCRAPLPINSNPGMVLPKQEFSDTGSMIRYGAKLTAGLLDFKIILDARALPEDIARGQLAGQSLCMEQYYRLLRSYRLPGFGQDKLVTFKSLSVDEPDHIIVACNNQFFSVPVALGSYRLTEADFAVQFERIMQMAKSEEVEEPPVGVLTSMNRNEWSEARNILITDLVNRTSLDAMERCVFVLCFDRTTNADSDLAMAHHMLHGCGPEHNSCNRWYDKTIQLVVTPDGTIGLSYEHSASEGIAVIALIEHLLKYMTMREKKGLYRSTSSRELPIPLRLKWEIDREVSGFLEAAKSNSSFVSENLDIEIFRFKEYGKEFIKIQNMSPDAYVQVALQLTYYNLYGHLVSTYESASTRRFRKGRVDNIRAATVQVLDFAKSFTNLDDSGKITMDAKKMILLRRAIKAQTDFTIAAITGHGIDCHLLGLRKMAEEMGLGVPDIFADPSYSLCNYFQLSTSQIPTNTDSFMCYGAVVPDGYGVSYNPHNDSIVFCVSSFKSCQSTNSKKFVTALGESLKIMANICLLWNQRRSSSLEIISAPSNLPLHRRLHTRSCSVEDDDNLRENEEEQQKTEKEAKQRSFLRQKSFTNSRQPRTLHRLSTLSAIPVSPQKKLDRRCSDVAINRPLNQTTDATLNDLVIPADLLSLIRQATETQQ
ncbi:unnamed protein product [Clavelina lepadiformis]|uniref:Choline O-acetyltransferase n=1 Tax=Clavelina lepadiformis TaxID=159417 RepID=A0ABP0FJS8_CLALP